MFIEQKVADLQQRVSWLETMMRSRLQSVPLQMEDVIHIVADFYHFKPQDFAVKHRTRNLAWARQVAMALCVELCHASSGEVGSAFGNRNHGTVLYAIRRVRESCQADKKCALDLEQIKRALLPQ